MDIFYCFQLLAVTDKTTMNIPVCFYFFWKYLEWNGQIVMIGICYVSLLQKRPKLFQSGYTVLHSHQQCTKILVASYPHQIFGVSLFSRNLNKYL